jgi:NAD(P)-dependent dehydrogenase (short-subunit alcohol dehydrogenase family)
MKTFRRKLAVVTGGGTGMGRELTTQLAADGCHVAIGDVSAENMAETKRLAEDVAIAGARVTTHGYDVSDERQVLAFRDAVVAEHQRTHVNLLFNNAGIGGRRLRERRPRRVGANVQRVLVRRLLLHPRVLAPCRTTMRRRSPRPTPS